MKQHNYFSNIYENLVHVFYFRDILKIKFELQEYFNTVSKDFKSTIYILWFNQVLSSVAKILSGVIMVRPLYSVVKSLLSGSNITLIVVGVIDNVLNRSYYTAPELFYFSTFLTFYSTIFDLYARFLFQKLNKKWANLIVEEQGNYIVTRSFQDYVTYKPAEDISNSIRVLTEELPNIWAAYQLFNPLYTTGASLFIVFLIISESITFVGKLALKFIPSIFNTMLVYFIPMFLFVTMYANVVISQSNTELSGNKMFSKYINLLSDFSSKIIPAYILNLVEKRHSLIRKTLRESLEIQYNIDLNNRKFLILDGMLQLIPVFTGYILFYQVVYFGSSIINVIPTACASYLYYKILYYILKNYAFNIVYSKIYSALEIPKRYDYLKGNMYCKKENISTKIHIKDLSFSINQKNEKKILLSPISFTINQKQKLAIIGPSGSGKSTLVKILSGLVNPLDSDKCILPENLAWTPRSNTILIPQDSTFFIGDVKDNIAGLNQPLDHNIIEDLGITDSILEKRLSYDARELSGGEKQRIALARALHVLKNQDCSTLIFDESFSALDPISKNRLLNYILERYSDKTILFVGHDPTILDKFDKIVYLKDTKLLFCGSFEQFKNTDLYKVYIS